MRVNACCYFRNWICSFVRCAALRNNSFPVTWLCAACSPTLLPSTTCSSYKSHCIRVSYLFAPFVVALFLFVFCFCFYKTSLLTVVLLLFSFILSCNKIDLCALTCCVFIPYLLFIRYSFPVDLCELIRFWLVLSLCALFIKTLSD